MQARMFDVPIDHEAEVPARRVLHACPPLVDFAAGIGNYGMPVTAVMLP